MLTVFGSINIDLVISVPAIAAPGETVLGNLVAEFPGGKGANQAVAAARAVDNSLRVVMVGATGDDNHGKMASNALASAGVSPMLFVDPDNVTGTAIIVIDENGENAITVIPGANNSLLSGHIPDSALKAEFLLCQAEVPMASTRATIVNYKQANPEGRTILNLAPVPALTRDELSQILRDIDFLIVNRSEGARVETILGKKLPSIANEQNLVIVVTLGAEGAVIHSGKAKAERISTLAVDPVDTTGAGDTFCGVFAAMLCEGKDIENATRIACGAGALACCVTGAQGTIPNYKEELKKLKNKK